MHLPISLPDPRVARYFLVAVTRGSYEAAKRFWGGGSSGSLMLNNSIAGGAHYASPFCVGFPLPDRRFVHVLDELTVDVLLEELDTLPDLVAYLECKEAYLNRTSVGVTAAGEEQLIARYICTLEGGKHALPTIPANTSFVAFIEGDWEYYSASPQRAAKKRADARSYVWDGLIEYQSSFIRAGTAVSLLERPASTSDHERIARALADECRLSRRHLAANLRHALEQSIPGKKFARVVISSDRRNRAYVFLTAPKPDGVSYAEYREMRSGALATYCHGVKLKFPLVGEVVGVASEPLSESFASQDFMYVDYSGQALDVEETVILREAMAELDVLQSPIAPMAVERTSEFPDTTELQANDLENGIRMNRKARRAIAKRRRLKRR